MCGALSCGQYRVDRLQHLVMAEWLGDKRGDEADAQGVLHEATPGRSLPTPQRMRYSIWERAPTPSQVLGREPLSSADRAHLMEICKTLEDFVDTILFQGSHA